MSETAQPGASDGAPEIPVDTTATAAPPDTPSPAGSEEHDDADDAGADEQPKRARGVQKRIDELTELRRQAERERDSWREVAMRGHQQAPQPAQPAAEAPLAPDLAQWVGPAPDPSKFQAGEYDPEYIRAAARHDIKVDQAKMFQQQRAVQAQQAQVQFGQKVAGIMQAAIAADPSIERTITADDFPMPRHVVAALAEADEPSVVLAHLAKNRAEAERIAKLSPVAAARELGKIEARLASPPAPALSAAPPPPRTLRAGGAPARDPSQARSMDEYVALRGG